MKIEINEVKRKTTGKKNLRIYQFGYLVILLMLTYAITGCNKDDDTKNGKDYKCINSDHSGYTTIEHNGRTREYILHLPASYDSSDPVPMIINFHGYGGCASDHAINVGDLNSLADNENFIVAYPQAVVGEKGDVYWDPGDNGIQSIEENDVYFTEQLISKISNEYNVDSSRIYAIGFSNGGMMSYGLACSRGNLIAAVGIMCGIMLPESCDANEYTSVIHFHGIDDDILPYEGNQYYQSVQDVVNYWLNHNGIPASSLLTTDMNGGDVVRKSYSGGNENTSVILYTIHELNGKVVGHGWFSGDIDGNSPNQILWDFLSSYKLVD